jgi:hypothetical protein
MMLAEEKQQEEDRRIMNEWKAKQAAKDGLAKVPDKKIPQVSTYDVEESGASS